MKKLRILAVMGVMIPGFLTLGAGTAHAGYNLVDECFDGLTKNEHYKLKKRNTNNWGVRYCNLRWCTWIWLVHEVSETKARANIPCL